MAAIDLRALRADPLFGALLARLSRERDLAVLTRASQIDVLGTLEDGEPSSWIAVIHGVGGPPRDGDIGHALGAGRALPSGATEYDGTSAGDLVATPGEWIVGEGPAFDRLRARPSLGSSPMVMPGRALVASTVQGRAVPRSRHEELADMTDGLEDATVAILGGAHLEMVFQCRYADATRARHAAAAARLMLLAEASQTDALSALARTLVKVDFDVSGTVVSLRVTISDDLRELLQSYVERAVSDD